MNKPLEPWNLGTLYMFSEAAVLSESHGSRHDCRIQDHKNGELGHISMHETN